MPHTTSSRFGASSSVTLLPLLLETDARCSPLVPPDLVELYVDALEALGNAAHHNGGFRAYFRRHLDKFSATHLGSADPAVLVRMLQEDLGVLRRLFWMVPWQLGARRQERAASSEYRI